MRTEIYTIRGKVRSGDYISLDGRTFYEVAIATEESISLFSPSGYIDLKYIVDGEKNFQDIHLIFGGWMEESGFKTSKNFGLRKDIYHENNRT